MKFKNLISLLFEKNKYTKSLYNNSDSMRKSRSEDVQILNLKKFTPSTTPKNKPLLKGWKLYEADTLSKEKTEGRKHSQYIVLDRNDNVKDVYCSCADFQFLWRYALTKKDVASWETYPEYKDIETHGPHTQKPSNITNPHYNSKLCKHLLRLFSLLKI